MTDKLYKALNSKTYHFIMASAFLWLMSANASHGNNFISAVCAGFSVLNAYQLAQKVKEH